MAAIRSRMWPARCITAPGAPRPGTTRRTPTDRIGRRRWQVLEAIRTREPSGQNPQRDDVFIERCKQQLASRQYSSLAFDHTGHGAGSSLCTSVDLAIVIIVGLAKFQSQNLISGIFNCVVQISEFINVDFGCVSAHLRRSGPGLNKRAPEAKMRDDETIPAGSVRDVSGILLDHIFRTFVPLWNILQHVRVVREETCRDRKSTRIGTRCIGDPSRSHLQDVRATVEYPSARAREDVIEK